MIRLFFILVPLTYVLVPGLTFWGWARYFAHKDKLSAFSVISCIGFGLATASGLLLAGAAVAARVVGFAHYDPRLKWVFLTGILLTATSVVASLIGIWGKNSLRWHAPACSLGMAVIWLYLLAAE